MNRRALALLAGLLLLALAPGPALAASVVDQKGEVENISWGGANLSSFAQTFTVGITGKLTSVDLRLSEDTAVSVTAHISALSGGSPRGTGLTSGSASVHFVAWYHFPLSPSVTVTAGQTYGIVFSVGSTGTVYGSTGDQYPGGQALIKGTGSWVPPQAGVDFEFRTYVEKAAPTPAPTLAPTPAPTPTPTPTPEATPTPTREPTPADTATPTATPTLTASATPGSLPDPGSGGPPLPIVGGGIFALGLALGGVGVLVLQRRRAGG